MLTVTITKWNVASTLRNAENGACHVDLSCGHSQAWLPSLREWHPRIGEAAICRRIYHPYQCAGCFMPYAISASQTVHRPGYCYAHQGQRSGPEKEKSSASGL